MATGFTPLAQWNAGQTPTVQVGQDTYTNLNYANPSQIYQELTPAATSLGFSGGDLEQWLNENGYGVGVEFGNGGLSSAITGPGGNVLGSHIYNDSAGADFLTAAALAAGGYFGGSALAGTAGGGGTAAGAAAGTGGLSSADAAALYSNAGYGAAMTGGETAAYDTALTVGGGAAAGAGAGGAATAAGAATAGGSMGSTGTWLQALSSIYGLYQGNQLQKMGAAADPFAPYRAGYAQQLQQLMQNPSSVTSLPGYKASQDAAEQALTRNLASQGLTGSGTAASALATEGAQFQNTYFQQMLQTLAGLSGATMNNAPLSLNAYAAGANTQNQSLQNLVKIMPALTGSGG